MLLCHTNHSPPPLLGDVWNVDIQWRSLPRAQEALQGILDRPFLLLHSRLNAGSSLSTCIRDDNRPR